VILQRINRPVTFSLTHNGNYASHRSRRPEVEVEIATVTASGVLIRTLRTAFVVDSGSDCSVLDEGYAAPLGIDLSRCPIERLGGIEGGEVLVRSSRVLMYLCERWVSVEVCFQRNRRPQVLGRQDVFDNLLIAFFHRASELYASTA
jgi:hypothetical protein